MKLGERAKYLDASSVKRQRLEEDPSVIKDALDSAASGVIITDKVGAIRYANPAFLKMFEYNNKTEIIGKPASDLFASQESRRLADVGAIRVKA